MHSDLSGPVPSVSVVSDSPSMRPIMRGVLLDVAPPLIAYYGLRAVGQSEYVALLTATVLSGLRVAYEALKARRLDPFAGYLLLTFGLSLAVGLATTDPKLVLLGNTVVNGIGGLVFLGSCVLGKPLTQVVAERVTPDDGDRDPGESAAIRRTHLLLSAMWGVGLLVEVGIRLVVISSRSVDVANGVNSVISLAMIGLLMAATFLVSRAARARSARLGEQRSLAKG
jgi:uncharacterized membrane protein